MILIICVDDKLGMMFNHRRQSKDRILRERILQMTHEKHLWMNNYSAKQFEIPEDPQINVDDNFLNEAEAGDFCFAEDVKTKPYEKWIDMIVVYRWNRNYPADFFFDIDLNAKPWKLLRSMDFKGSSHDKITEEIYVK